MEPLSEEFLLSTEPFRRRKPPPDVSRSLDDERPTSRDSLERARPLDWFELGKKPDDDLRLLEKEFTRSCDKLHLIHSNRAVAACKEIRKNHRVRKQVDEWTCVADANSISQQQICDRLRLVFEPRSGCERESEDRCATRGCLHYATWQQLEDRRRHRQRPIINL